MLLAGLTWVLKPAPTSAPQPLVRFEYELPAGVGFRNAGRNVLAFSPDGRHFAYNTPTGLYLRSMDTLTARLVPGTEDSLTNPFFSPDGNWVAYASAGELKKIAVSGGAPVTICAAINPFGASWGTDGTILFGQPGGVMRVSQDGGTPELVVRTEQGEQAHGPQMLPDGKTILFTVTGAVGNTRWDQAQIVAQSTDSGERKVLLQGGSDARYAPTGHLIYALENNLFAVPFDVNRLTVGGASPIVQRVQRAAGAAQNTAAANYGFSNNGALVYLEGTNTAQQPDAVLAIVDRKGGARNLNVPPGQYRSPRVSPDSRQIAVETVAANGQSAISIYDLSGNTAIRRLTQEGNNSRPVWTTDSKRVAFYSDREKPAGIYYQLADGSGLPERLTTVTEGTIHVPESWSRDGVLSFASVAGTLAPGGGDWSLHTLSLDKKDKPSPYYDVPNSNQFGSTFSPDGKWIAYASNEGGNLGSFGIFAQPFPATGVKYEISHTGGAWPVWSPMGTELFYRLNVLANSPTTINAVTITTKPAPAFSSEQTLPLKGFLIYQNYRDYDILPNGREFVMVMPVNQPAAAEPERPRIHVVLNWFDELKARVPSPQ